MDRSERSKAGQIAVQTPILEIVCGADGVDATQAIVGNLPASFGAALVVSLQGDAAKSDGLADLLRRVTTLPVRALGEVPVIPQPGHIYLVPADHLVLQSVEGWSAVAEDGCEQTNSEAPDSGREIGLSDRESHLRRVIDNTPFFIGVLASDGTLLEANATAIRGGGLERSDVVGKKFWECYWWKFDPRKITSLKDAVRRAAAGESVRYDEVVRMANDTRMTIDFMLSPVRGADGRVAHIIASGVDIQDRKEAERLLADAKSRLDLAMEVSRVAAWSWDMATNSPVSNSNLNRLFGFEPDDDPDLDVFLDRIHEADRDRVAAAIAHSLQSGDPYQEEYRITLASGETRWLRARGRTSTFSDGAVKDFQGVVSDVTEHKVFELELADREAHLRRVINNQLGFVGVIGRDGVLLEVDDSSLRIAGLTRDDVIGKHFAECAWWTYDSRVSQQMRETMERAFAGETVRYDVPLYAPGSNVPDKRLMIDFMLAPVRGEDGNISHLISSGVDISDRVEAERARKDNEERLQMALEAGGMAAWEWNPRESVWTDAVYELLGISAEREASPELFFSCVHPEDVAGLKAAWKQATAGNVEYSHEFRVVRANGEVRWVVGVGKVVRDDNGNVVRLFGLNWDSTKEHLAAEALRESEQKAQLANASKSEFIANMSHEIRTPMTAVLGYADLLLAQETDLEKLGYLRTIQRNGKFLLGIINDILDLSKIEAGKLDIATERFSVAEVVGDVRSMMSVRAAEHQLKFETSFDGSIPEQIESDPKRLRQILINLVGNAIKFTESGSVRLTVREVKVDGRAAIQFDVVDTGIGMTPDQQNKLFRAFSQGDASVTRAYGGTGLGLAISRRLARMLGGEIEVESEVGKGSRFTFTIAAGDIADQTRDQPILGGDTESLETYDPAANTEMLDGCRVFVVDDRRDVRFLSNRLLTRAGAKVDEAADGLEAIERLESDPGFRESIDLVLLDMQMPRLDGYQTARRLRELGFAKPIVALTADAMQSDMNRCLESGCDEYLSKPIDTLKLLDTVTRLTRG